MTHDTNDLIVALDIGTSQVLAVVAKVLPDGKFEVLSQGSYQSQGMRKGVVVNIEDTVDSIQRAIGEAEFMADCKIREVYTGITGAHITSVNSKGMATLKGKEATYADVARAVEMASALKFPNDQQILHVLEREFKLDNLDNIRDPVGMSGLRLDAEVHIVTASSNAVQHIIKCVRLCGMEVQRLTLNPLASSLACLSRDEKELGVLFIDIGAGTSDVAIYSHGTILYTEVVPIAGNQITNDIAVMLNTPILAAEDIKLRHGAAKQVLVDPEEIIEIPGLGDRAEMRAQKRQTLAAIIEPRLTELFGVVQQLVCDQGYENFIGSGVVLTGGSALMPGIVELAEDVFRKPVRVAVPDYEGNLQEVVRNPRFSTVIGLLKEVEKQRGRERKLDQKTSAWSRRWQRIKDWF